MHTIGPVLVVSAVLAAFLIGGSHVYYGAKRGLHRAGCAVERVVGKRCPPPKLPPLSNFSTADTAAGEAAWLLARKLELQLRMALEENTPELREEYARVRDAWNAAENAAMGIRK